MIFDIILTIVCIAFSYSLIPQIIKCMKNKSGNDLSYNFLIITLIGLLIISIIYIVKNLYFSAITNMITASCYGILVYLKYKYK
jgi:uncharacterized protein with PQ loop repeat